MDGRAPVQDGSRRGLAAVLLLPVALVFSSLVLLRRLLYRAGLLASIRLPVPVVVVGNITVGGAGKTPLVLWLVYEFLRRGRRPGIVSRGYGGSVPGVHEVQADDAASLVGDEPLLLKTRAGFPVFVGRDRVAAARAVLHAHPDCDLIVSDDGLQHYRLGRNFEIAVVDRQLAGNGWMLPAGPLRDLARLAGGERQETHVEEFLRVSALHRALSSELKADPTWLAGALTDSDGSDDNVVQMEDLRRPTESEMTRVSRRSWSPWKVAAGLLLAAGIGALVSLTGLPVIPGSGEK